MTKKLRYAIGNISHQVEVFEDGSSVPFLRQPHWPSGQPWESKEQAEDWAKLFVESVVNAEAPYAPTEPGKPGKPKPTKEEIENYQKSLNLQNNINFPNNN